MESAWFSLQEEKKPCAFVLVPNAFSEGIPLVTRSEPDPLDSRTLQLDPYKAYVQERLAAGQRNVKHLIAELREQGYRQGATIVYDYVRRLCEQPQWQQAVKDAKKRSPLAAGQPLSAREAAWLFVRNPRKLRFAQAVKLDDVRRLGEDLDGDSLSVSTGFSGHGHQLARKRPE